MARQFNNGTVEINRGDSFTIVHSVNIGTKLEKIIYKLKDSDFVYMGIMEPNQPFECAIVRKKLSSKNQDDAGNILIELTPQDSQCLLPGKYYYQIKLATASGDVVTIVDKTQLFILE